MHQKEVGKRHPEEYEECKRLLERRVQDCARRKGGGGKGGGKGGSGSNKMVAAGGTGYEEVVAAGGKGLGRGDVVKFLREKASELLQLADALELEAERGGSGAGSSGSGGEN